MILRVDPNVTTLVKGQGGLLSRWLRVKNESAKYSPAFQMGAWDGYEHFFDRDTKSFPTGLLHFVKRKCLKFGIDLKLKRTYTIPDTPMVEESFLNGITLRDYQLEAVNTLLQKGRGCESAVTGSGKTAMIAAVAGSLWLHHGARTLVIVPRKGLLHQTHEELKGFLGLDIDIGIVGDGRRQTKSSIVIATPQTLRFALPEKSEFIKSKCHVSRKNEPILTNLVRSVDCLILDEAHHASSDTIYEIGLLCSARWRFGFSGTPLKKKKFEDLRLMSLVGKIVHQVHGKTLVDKGLLARPDIYMIKDPYIYEKVSIAGVDYTTAVNKALIKNKRYNRCLCRVIQMLVESDKPPIVFAPRLQHIRVIAKILEKMNVPFETIVGEHDMLRRLDVKKRYKQGDVFALLCTSVFDEGEDVPNTPALIMAGGGKTHIALKQRLGRGMRRKDGDNKVFVVDFTHDSSVMLRRHADRRMSIYRKEGYAVTEIDSLKELKQYI